MIENWRDPYGAMTTDRSIKIKVFLHEGYRFSDENEEDLKKYLPCIAIIDKIIGDCLYRFTMLTEDGPIKSVGYADAMPIELYSELIENARSSITKDDINVFSKECMIEISKDKKSPTWIITKTDAEGFHHQLALTEDELNNLLNLLLVIL